MQREPLDYQFVRIAKQLGRKLAIIDRGLKRSFTYRQALTASIILADKLKSLSDPLVGVILPTSASAALIIIALLMDGKTPVLLNYSTGVEANVELAKKKCHFKDIITARVLLEKLKVPRLDGFVYVEDLLNKVSVFDKVGGTLKASLSAERILSSVHRHDIDSIAAILFTTGTEDEPKAVPLTHRNINANLEALKQIYPFSPNDIMLATLPFFHVFGLTTNLWLPLRFGMTIVSYVNPMDYKAICTIIAEDRPTYLVGTPSFLWGYLHHSEPGDFNSLKLIVTGSDKCPESLRTAYQEKHGLMIYEGYGTTETSPIIAVNTPDRFRHGSVGWVLPNLQLRIEGYDTGKDCRIGEVGRILVKGESVFTGYFDDKEATARSLRDGWYDTGDLGYIDGDGFLWHVGRWGRSVKIGGEMVSLTRVETTLETLLPKDTAFCVVGIPDLRKGVKIVAAITQPIDERRVLQEMSKRLPAIAIPKNFVVLQELPRTSGGKIDFKRVAEVVKELVEKG